MTTNQEWLFSLTLEEYLKWMESEHSEPKDDASSYGADFKAVEMDASRFEAVEMDASRLVVNEPDSREKLEADVRKHYAYSTTTLMYPPSANKTTDMLRALPVDTVIGWLDRQAAITREEADAGCKECFTERREREREFGKTIDGLTEQVALERRKELELTAERDKLKEEIVKYGHDCTLLFDEKHKLTAERDEWKTKCETREIAYKQADAERKRYSEQIDELAAERDQLTKAINELQKKQPYCYNPGQPLDSLNKIGRDIDELKSRNRNLVDDLARVSYERDNLEVNNLQLHTLAGEQAATIDELTAERDNLKELNEYHAHQYELASEDIDRMHAQADELNATIGKLQKQVNELMIR